MIKSWGALIALAFLVALPGIGWVVTRAPEKSIVNHDPSKNEHRYKHQYKISDNNKSNSVHAQYDPSALSAFAAFISAAAAFITTVFTGVLLRVNWGLWDVTRRQVELAEREFVATHRPKIIVRHMAAFVPGGNIFIIQYDIVNSGESTAEIKEHNAVAVFSPDALAQKAITKTLKIRVLQAGDHQTVRVRFSRDEYAASFATHGGKITVKGWVTYTDARGVSRETRFCRTYDGMKQRFARSDDPEEEYSD